MGLKCLENRKNIESSFWYFEKMALIFKRYFLKTNTRYAWACLGNVNIVMVSQICLVPKKLWP